MKRPDDVEQPSGIDFHVFRYRDGATWGVRIEVSAIVDGEARVVTQTVKTDAMHPLDVFRMPAVAEVVEDLTAHVAELTSV